MFSFLVVMATKITFEGGAGSENYIEEGEMGLQIFIEDEGKKTKFGIDPGNIFDRSEELWTFPYKLKSFDAINAGITLELIPDKKDLYRHDYELRRGNIISKYPPINGFIVTHPHADHMGLMDKIRYDCDFYMPSDAILMAYIWQKMSGNTINQFIDLYGHLFEEQKKTGRMGSPQGEKSCFPRDIHTIEPGKPFKIGNIDFVCEELDHSIPGTVGISRMELSDGIAAMMSDAMLRGRRPELTRNFLEKAKGADFLFIEASLIDIDHYGTEDDLSNVVADLMIGKQFAGTLVSPRNLERMSSLYKACKKMDRMLLVPPDTATYLKAFNGRNGYPKLTDRNIGVLPLPKNKGYFGNSNQEVPFDQLIGDYFKQERQFLYYKRWDPKKGHEGKKTLVSLDDVARHQDRFLMIIQQSAYAGILAHIKPKSNSIIFRSIPSPYTPSMADDERRQIEVEKKLKIYDGPQEDYLDALCLKGKQGNLFEGETIRIHKKHQVHVTGHFNRYELADVLRNYVSKNTIVIVDHAQYPDKVKKLAPHLNIFIPKRGVTYDLREIRESFN